MIPKKYTSYVFSFFMALLMSCLMSLVVSIVNLGFVENLVSAWMRAWRFSFFIGFPSILLVTPIVRLLVALTIEKDDQEAP